MEKKNHILSNTDRKIRLTNYDRSRLYRLLLKESGLEDEIEEKKSRVDKYCEKLIWKYIIPDNFGDIYPGCERICNKINSFIIVFEQDFDITVPSFKKADLMPEIQNFMIVKLEKYIPNIFQEAPVWYSRTNSNYYTGLRFAPRIKQLATKDELKTLNNLMHDYISAEINCYNYLKDTRVASRNSWERYIDFGKFFNLGALYDYNHEYAFRMKYDILGIVDPEPKDESTDMAFEKSPAEFTALQNIDRLRQILK